jgi:hypothetical protein
MTEARISRLETNLRFVWSEYLRWYTFLSTLNLVGLGFFVGTGRHTGWPVPAAFLMFNVLGLITAILMLPYTHKVTRLVDSLDDAALVDRPEQKLRGTQSGIPKGIAYWGATANAVSLILFIALWTYLLACPPPLNAP